ncbi:helix-turn-helix domain-containing protein, partial [Paenibacillus sepulcri]|nr:helix-turn-helix domain-containing protein [Paenibacillus sepulcri]
VGARKLTEAGVSGLCGEIRHCVNHYLKLSVSIGIGAARLSILDLPASYREAVSALREKTYAGKGSVIRFKENASADPPRPVLYPSEEEKTVIHCLQTLNKEDLSRAVDGFFAGFVTGGASIESIRNICGRLIVIALSSVEDIGVDVQNDFGSRYSPYKEAEKFDTLEDLRQWIGSLLGRITELVRANKSLRFKSLVKIALHYMQENYNREMSLREVAGVVHVTPNYLSRVFKEEMGVAFTEWLNRFRVEKAKALLGAVDAKTYSVAEKVGFNDYKYFSNIFKKHTGYSPRAFKELRQRQ